MDILQDTLFHSTTEEILSLSVCTFSAGQITLALRAPPSNGSIHVRVQKCLTSELQQGTKSMTSELNP